jgi:predicted O-methyltransferase YrrM
MREHGYKVTPEQKPEEFEWLLDRVEHLNPKRILELGTRLGAALCTFARVSPACELAIGVDDPLAGWDNSATWHLWNLKATVTAIVGSTHDRAVIARVNNYAPFDFLFIDADHKYAAVKQDYLTYSPMINPGGIIAFHDITPSCPYVSVSKLWEEIKATGAITEEFILDPNDKWAGIGLVRV